jgi:hypothetical protein
MNKSGKCAIPAAVGNRVTWVLVVFGHYLKELSWRN